MGATPSRFKSARPQFFAAFPRFPPPKKLSPSVFYRLLYLLPKNHLSYLVGWLVSKQFPFGLHTLIRNWFISAYRVDVSEAELPLENYPTMGDLFVRRLKPGARPLASETLVSPVDGALTQAGRFVSADPTLTQIKGMDYSLRRLVGPEIDIRPFEGGGFLTIYLAPFNYHRIHAPIAGKIDRVAYIPGALWPVNTWSVGSIKDLFVVNERVIVELTGRAGGALVVMVGATNVGKITLDFTDQIVGNGLPPSPTRLWKPAHEIAVEKGAGLGCFELGSTVVLILDKSLMDALKIKLPSGIQVPLRMGQGLTH